MFVLTSRSLVLEGKDINMHHIQYLKITQSCESMFVWIKNVFNLLYTKISFPNFDDHHPIVLFNIVL
jgi:hypothetical protein